MPLTAEEVCSFREASAAAEERVTEHVRESVRKLREAMGAPDGLLSVPQRELFEPMRMYQCFLMDELAVRGLFVES